MLSKHERSGNFFFSISLLTGLLLSGCGAHVFHEVRKDETLYLISTRYNHDYRQVAEWNGLAAPYTIMEGQWLRVAPPGPDAGLRPPAYANGSQQSRKQTNNKKSEIKQPSQVTTAKSSSASTSPSASSSPSYSSADIHWRWPVNGKVTRAFADKPGKQGIDIAGSAGTIINASAAGKVVYSGNGLRGYGNLIIIKHNEKFLSAYAHNQSILVNDGAFVKQGEAIARMGSTESNQVKLHFQIRVNGRPVDPLRYLPK